MLNENVDEEFVRKIAAQVVKAEMVKEVYPIKEWMWSLWSNGSGRPEGYLQMARKADDLRYKQLADETKEQSEILRELKENMQIIALEKKVDLALKEERTKKWAKRWPIIKWVLGIIGTAALALGGWTIHKVEPVIEILWKDAWSDYMKSHPASFEKIKNLSQDDHDLIYAVKHKQDDFAHW